MRRIVIVSVAFTVAGCGMVMNLDNYRPCSGAECSGVDGGSDDGSTTDVAPPVDAGKDVVLGGACATSADCKLPAPVCGGTKTCASVVKLARGESNHNCALLSDGTVTCWGRNPSGQLGIGVKTQPGHPVIVQGLGSVASVGVGWNYSCALDTNGAVWCWGADVIGGGVQFAFLPHKATLPPGKAIFLATGPESACVIMSDNGVKSVWCWGNNGNGSITTVDAGTSFATPVQFAGDGTDADEVAISDFSVCVLHAGKTRLRCSGDNSHGIFASKDVGSGDTALPASPVLALHMGEIHACDIQSDGTAACWGWNYLPNFGGTAGNVASPTPLFAATEISPAYQGTCAIVGGSVQCAGNNGHGAAGDWTSGGTNDWGSPVQDGQKKVLDNVVDVALHRQFACAIQQGGKVWCWGQNVDGNDPTQGYWLGDGTNVIDRNHAEPVVW